MFTTTVRKRAGQLSLGLLLALPMSEPPRAWSSADGTLELHGFVENATFTRSRVGLSKVRNTGQLELSKAIGAVGIFSEFSFHGTFRGTYDGVYELNDDEWGDKAGSAQTFQSTGAPPGVLPGPFAAGLPTGFTGWMQSPVQLFGATGPTAGNPNAGLRILGRALHGQQGGAVLGVPVRPCDEDRRGCIDGYMDAKGWELASPEFNSRADVIREAYLDATIALRSGHEIAFRLGRQQVVWGRTDLFRVLDVINPVDFSRQNIYEELEDIRIPMGILNMEYRAGAAGMFEDLNFQLLWKFEQFRPHSLGQGGSPYAILQAGDFFRAMNNCWDNGCTVGNFAFGAAATDFGPRQIGIRRADMPNWSVDSTDVGMRMEGVYKGVGFSANALYYNSQLPSLRGGITSVDPFTGASGVYPYALAFDIAFPRIFLVGGSADFYVDPIKSAFRVELAHTTGEEFANTMRPRLFSESNVIRYVVGWDRPTFIPLLNNNRAFLISAQVFGQHLLDHELGNGPLGKVGIPDWEENWVTTLLVQGFYKNDQILPRIIMAYDVRAQAAAIAPQVDWLINDSWRLVVGANFKVGNGERRFDDNRSALPYPLLAALATGSPAAMPSAGLGGFEPLGRFRSGPIGMAQAEDEIQVTLRYRF